MNPWYSLRHGNPVFRRYVWSLFLALSISNAIKEAHQLWRAYQDQEASQ